MLPGFGLTLGFTILYLSLLVLMPLLGALFVQARPRSRPELLDGGDRPPRALAAYRLSFGASARRRRVVNARASAWSSRGCSSRYRFPGKGLVDALVDLPFALPTAVAGIALTALLAKNGWIGQLARAARHRGRVYTARRHVALTFIGLPFVVRTVQPVLEELETEVEEAAASLGAGRCADLPARDPARRFWPALVTGFALAFARALGEYGSVVFISGNMPMKTEIAPLLIVTKLEQYDYAGATAIAAVMLVLVVRAAARHQRAAGARTRRSRRGAAS